MEGGGDRDQAMVRVEEARQRLRSARERALVAKRRELAALSERSSGTRRWPRCRSGSAIPSGRPMPACMLGGRGS
jgi:hypothetical protein